MHAHTKPDLARDLSECLGNTVVFKFLAQGYHWNVRGPQFVQFHDLFGEIYEEAEGAVDHTAELIRVLGYDAPYLLTDLAKLSEIEPRGISSNDPLELAAALYAANNVVLECLNKTFACADGCNEQGIADFVAGRIDAHQKLRWQLGTIIGADSTTPSMTAPDTGDDFLPTSDWTEPEEMLVMLASAHGVNAAVLRASYRRAIEAGENPAERVTELAQKKYDSRDADLLPRR